MLVVVVAIGANRPDGRFRMTVLDIGQGDAILLEGSRGARMLIDGGPDPDLLLSRLDERIPAWDRRLDLLVLSHPHEDHVAGMALLLSRYRVGAIAETGMLGNGPGDHAFRAVLAQLGLGTVLLAAGDSVQLDDATLSVLWPRRGEVPLHPAERRERRQQRLGRVRPATGASPHAAHRRHRGGHRPAAAGGGARARGRASGGRAQGGAPRKPNGDDERTPLRAASARSRSSAPASAIRTGIRARPRSIDSRRWARRCCARTSMAT